MPQIENPWIFYAAAGLLVGYVLFMMIRRRRGERPGSLDRDREPIL
jgi:hypothetical protein